MRDDYNFTRAKKNPYFNKMEDSVNFRQFIDELIDKRDWSNAALLLECILYDTKEWKHFSCIVLNRMLGKIYRSTNQMDKEVQVLEKLIEKSTGSNEIMRSYYQRQLNVLNASLK